MSVFTKFWFWLIIIGTLMVAIGGISWAIMLQSSWWIWTLIVLGAIFIVGGFIWSAIDTRPKKTVVPVIVQQPIQQPVHYQVVQQQPVSQPVQYQTVSSPPIERRTVITENITITNPDGQMYRISSQGQNPIVTHIQPTSSYASIPQQSIVSQPIQPVLSISSQSIQPVSSISSQPISYASIQPVSSISSQQLSPVQALTYHPVSAPAQTYVYSQIPASSPIQSLSYGQMVQ